MTEHTVAELEGALARLGSDVGRTDAAAALALVRRRHRRRRIVLAAGGATAAVGAVVAGVGLAGSGDGGLVVETTPAGPGSPGEPGEPGPNAPVPTAPVPVPPAKEVAELSGTADAEVFLRRDATLDEIEAVRAVLVASDAVAEFQYLDQEAAHARMRAQLADENPELVELLESESLPTSFLVRLADGADVSDLEAVVRAVPGVYDVAASDEWRDVSGTVAGVTATTSAPVTATTAPPPGPDATAPASVGSDVRPPGSDVRPLDEVRVLVVNGTGGRVPGGASALSEQIRDQGYPQVLTPADGPLHATTTAYFAPGFDADCQRLAAFVAQTRQEQLALAPITATLRQAAPAAAAADCVVVLAEPDLSTVVTATTAAP
jgi:hypothetical protein